MFGIIYIYNNNNSKTGWQIKKWLLSIDSYGLSVCSVGTPTTRQSVIFLDCQHLNVRCCGYQAVVFAHPLF